jgi:hypothetical protein
MSFNDLLTLSFDEPCLAFGEMDDRIIFFCGPTKKYAIAGDGPDALGNNSNFTNLEQIHSDAPLLAPFSIVLVPDGLMFQSTKGLYTLTRALQEIPVTDVTDELQGTIVTSAVYMQDRFEIRLGLDSGETVIYQTLFKQWSTVSNWFSLAILTSLGYTMLDTVSGNLIYAVAGQNQDWNTNPIDWKFQVPWYSFASLNGYQQTSQLYVLLNFNGIPEDSIIEAINIGVAYDFDPNIVYTALLTSPFITTGYPQSFVHWIRSPMCQSITLTFSPNSPSTSQITPSFEAISWEVGVEPYGVRLPATYIVG